MAVCGGNACTNASYSARQAQYKMQMAMAALLPISRISSLLSCSKYGAAMVTIWTQIAVQYLSISWPQPILLLTIT